MRGELRYRRRSAQGRRGLILVVVLVMVALLSLLAASYTFMVRAHVETLKAQAEQFKARMAADAGLQNAIVILRDNSGDLDQWYDSEELHRGFLVYGGENETEGTEAFRERSDDQRTYDPQAEPSLRVNLVAPNFDDPRDVRYGITDECARLDLNVATDAQFLRLFEEVIPQDTDIEVDIPALVASLIGWRTPGFTEEAYGLLDPPYRNRGAPFSTVEELLLVKGFTGWVVFGEDYNQNGLLEPNEDDGDESFPPDDGNGQLFRGVAAYLTVWAQDPNTTGDNRPRINLNMEDLDKLREDLEEDEIDGDIINYVMSVRGGGIAFSSVMNLLEAPPTPEDEQSSPEDGSPAPTTQGSRGASTSQPDNENDAGSQSGLTDQNGSNSGSENTGSAAAIVYQNLTAESPPGTVEQLPLLLDRLTADPSPMRPGRINVSTASRAVLATLEVLTDAELDALMEARKELQNEQKNSPAWLLSENVLSEWKFRQILDKVTTKSSVYRVEAVGYADHFGSVARILTVIQMRGPIPQVIYYRDLGKLGTAYTPHGDERRELANRSD